MIDTCILNKPIWMVILHKTTLPCPIHREGHTVYPAIENMKSADHICTSEDVDAEPIWVDRGGFQYLCMCEITDNHLLNIIRWLENHASSMVGPYPAFNGEMAQYYAESAWEKDNEEFGETLDIFRDEAKRRRIDKWI